MANSDCASSLKLSLGVLIYSLIMFFFLFFSFSSVGEEDARGPTPTNSRGHYGIIEAKFCEKVLRQRGEYAKTLGFNSYLVSLTIFKPLFSHLEVELEHGLIET